MHKVTAALLAAYNKFADAAASLDAHATHLLEELHADMLRALADAKAKARAIAAQARARAERLEQAALDAEEKAIAYVETELAKIGRKL